MDFHGISLEQRVQEDINRYELEHLLPDGVIQNCLRMIASLTKAGFLLTNRNGEHAACTDDFAEFQADVINEPGIKIQVENRTIGYLYLSLDQVAPEKKKEVEQLFEELVAFITAYAQESYLHKELDLYTNELEQRLEKEKYRVTHGDKEDVLTGTLNRTYFVNRRQIVDRSEVLPVAEVCVNINDWKYVYDHFGNEESDRLIRVVADILKQHAKEDYVIGRTDGDVFTVLIPMAEDGEGQHYAAQVQEACMAFEDPHIAPSVACGVAVKYNVEQSLEELYSDAEYEMFDNKYQIKNAPGYRERLEKGGK